MNCTTSPTTIPLRRLAVPVLAAAAMIVHADADDLTSQPSGAAGARVGCGVIEIDVSQAYQPEAGS